MFDWAIRFGDVLQIVSLTTVVGVIYGMIRGDIGVLRRDFQSLEKRQDSLNDAFTQLGQILTQVAVQDNRLHMVEKNIDELRHGQGFIKA